MQRNAEPAGASAHLSADRMASLSDTMFGVAMTLVATTLLPAIEAHRGSVLDMLPAMQGELVTVLLSFTISARYWILQQRRLAMSRSLTSYETFLHLAFLFLIVLVPISTSLSGLGGAQAARGPVLIYGAHLCLLGLVNLLLWIGVHRRVAVHEQVARSALTLALFITALAVDAVRPDLAIYLWFAVLAMQPLAGYLVRRRATA